MAKTDSLPVLVVDDDGALIRTLSDILRLNGYAPQTAATGAEGLAMAGEHVPALAIVDLRLPDMDGMELVTRLHRLSELTEVVVLTGNATVESAIAAMRENSIDYLIKPVQVEKFLHVTAVAAERWQRRQAEAKLLARARQQAAVATLGQRAVAGGELDDLFADATRLVAETLDLRFTGVLELRTGSQSLVLKAGTGWPEGGIDVFQTSASGDSQAGDTVRHNRAVIFADLQAEQRFADSRLLHEFGIRSGVTVPIPASAGLYGVLGAHDTQPREFTVDDVHFLQAVAHVIGSAVSRMRSESAARQAQRLEAVGRVAGSVAHDFNNVLTAIIGYTELVQSGLSEVDPIQKDVSEILKASERGAGLTRQLLAFSRQQVLQPRAINLNDTVTGIESMLRRLVGKQTNMEVRLAPEVGEVKADPSQIEQVILNLCVNARDAMLAEGGTLSIETHNADVDSEAARGLPVAAPGQPVLPPGRYAVLTVKDTGVGMDADTRARIFEPFFTTKAPEHGTGLGLATVYGIVQQSGGELVVQSEPGHGSTFSVFLPQLSHATD